MGQWAAPHRVQMYVVHWACSGSQFRLHTGATWGTFNKFCCPGPNPDQLTQTSGGGAQDAVVFTAPQVIPEGSQWGEPEGWSVECIHCHCRV